MRHRKQPAEQAHHHEQGVGDHDERDQQDADDAEDQPHHQHPERRDHQRLRHQAGREGAAEGVADGVGDDLELGPAEEDEGEAEEGEGEEDPNQAGGAEERPHRGASRGRRRGRRRRHLREGGDLAAHRAAAVPHPPADREHVALDHGPAVEHHVAVHGDEVADHPAVDVGRAAEHEEVAPVDLARPDREVAPSGLAAGDGEAELVRRRGMQQGAEPVLEGQAVGETGQVHRGAAGLGHRHWDGVGRGGGGGLDRLRLADQRLERAFVHLLARLPAMQPADRLDHVEVVGLRQERAPARLEPPARLVGADVPAIHPDVARLEGHLEGGGVAELEEEGGEARLEGDEVPGGGGGAPALDPVAHRVHRVAHRVGGRDGGARPGGEREDREGGGGEPASAHGPPRRSAAPSGAGAPGGRLRRPGRPRPGPAGVGPERR